MICLNNVEIILVITPYGDYVNLTESRIEAITDDHHVVLIPSGNTVTGVPQPGEIPTPAPWE